ncbi:hypothetical protein CJU90_1242 [Yarrowia sp. C11]|nr:hypothetical protein CKK34_2656 [Yarrowia sp. E02]KAG5373528.1 hypothetical protein CJU90_1242 [Yarrowia sp. C11]
MTHTPVTYKTTATIFTTNTTTTTTTTTAATKENIMSDDLANTLQMCDICKGYFPFKEFDVHIKMCSEYYQKLKSVKSD